MRSKSFGAEPGQGLYSVYYLLLLAFTGLGLIVMPGMVGADWPGWSSTMFGVAVLALPTAGVLLGVSAGSAAVARWIAVVAVGLVLARLLWSLYDAGAVLLIAMVPVLVVLLVVALVLVHSWPRATSRELADVARAHGWEPIDLAQLKGLPVLPLPVGRTWVARNAVRAPGGVAFEVRWLQWHGVLCRRRRLAVLVKTALPQALPPMEVRPGSGLTRSDLTLESAEFNRSFDVIGEDARYVMAVLHPRTMQALLDGRPIGLAIAATALVAHAPALDSETLVRGLSTLERIDVPGHVFERWGRHPGQPPQQLQFSGPGFNPSRLAVIGRLTSLASALLAVTLAACLAAAAADQGSAFDPPRSVASLLIAVLVLAVVAVGAAFAVRPRQAHGSA